MAMSSWSQIMQTPAFKSTNSHLFPNKLHIYIKAVNIKLNAYLPYMWDHDYTFSKTLFPETIMNAFIPTIRFSLSILISSTYQEYWMTFYLLTHYYLPTTFTLQ